MKRVGIYIFSDMIKQRTAKKRDTFFDGQNYIGLRYIVSEINKEKYTIDYVSKDTIDTCDFVLVSIISYYDNINIINELYGKKHNCTIIAGGPGLINVELIKDIIDVAIIGRGECLINDILSGNIPDGVWSKNENYNFSKQLKVQELKKYIEIEDPILGYYKESAIGCVRKCFFCEYSWKNKFQTKTDTYTSGIAERETLLQEVNWSTYKNKDLVTAVDGIDEKTRMLINKPIKNSEITSKIMEIYDSGKDYLSLKLYCLLGYPFQNEFNPNELLESIYEASGRGANRLNIVIVSPHFMPMPYTPMELEPVNTTNFRKKVSLYNFEKYQTSNIKIYWPEMTTSAPSNACEATVVNRAMSNDAKIIKNVICSSKYISLDSSMKIKVIQKYFNGILDKVENVVPYIKRPHNVDVMKKRYYNAK